MRHNDKQRKNYPGGNYPHSSAPISPNTHMVLMPCRCNDLTEDGGNRLLSQKPDGPIKLIVDIHWITINGNRAYGQSPYNTSTPSVSMCDPAIMMFQNRILDLIASRSIYAIVIANRRHYFQFIFIITRDKGSLQ